MTQAEKEVEELQERFCPTCQFQDAADAVGSGCTRGVLDEYKDIPGAWRPGEDVECEEWKQKTVKVRVVCVWCWHIIGEEFWNWYPGLDVPYISYGICSACQEKEAA